MHVPVIRPLGMTQVRPWPEQHAVVTIGPEVQPVARTVLQAAVAGEWGKDDTVGWSLQPCKACCRQQRNSTIKSGMQCVAVAAAAVAEQQPPTQTVLGSTLPEQS